MAGFKSNGETDIFDAEMKQIIQDFDSLKNDVITPIINKILICEGILDHYVADGDNISKIRYDILNLKQALTNIVNATLLTEKEIERNRKTIRTFLGKLASNTYGVKKSSGSMNGFEGTYYLNSKMTKFSEKGIEFTVTKSFIGKESGNTTTIYSNKGPYSIPLEDIVKGTASLDFETYM